LQERSGGQRVFTKQYDPLNRTEEGPA